MPTNDLLPFGTGVGANVLDQTTYAALSGRTAGFAAGTAVSAQLNKVWRQASFAAAMIGQYTADNSGQNVVDDGNVATFETSFTKALAYPAQNQTWVYAADTGAASALVITPSPAPTAYVAGQSWAVKLANDITGATTINVSGLGAKSIVLTGGSALQKQDYKAGDVIRITYDGTKFQCMTPVALSLIDTAIVRTVHGAGADFADLNAAFAWLSRRRIAQTGSVAFNIAAGQFSYSTSVIIDHADLNRVTVNGATLLAAAPSSSTFVITGSSSGARATDRANHLAALRGIYATELAFVGATGIVVSNQVATLTNLLITGDRTGSVLSNLLLARSSLNVSNVSVHGGGGYGVSSQGGAIFILSSGVLTASGNVADGIGVQESGAIQLANIMISCSNDGQGMNCFAGSVRASGTQALTMRGNGGSGTSLSWNAALTVGPSFFQNNALDGLTVTQSAANVNGSAFGNNAGWGISAYQGRVRAQSASFATNTSGPATATAGSCIDVQLSTGAGSGTSPALNTVGNANSYILG